MKFLVIGTAKDAVMMLPAALLRQLFEASQATRDQQKKAGIILDDYMIAGQRRPVFIYECQTGEELSRKILEAPITSYMDFEIYPLADFSESISLLIEKIKAAEQMATPPK